jgi:hypothetical protein
MHQFLLKLNLQTFADDMPESWSSYLSESTTEEVADDQPTEESETETVEETEGEEITEHEVEPDGEETTEETEEPLFNDETEIELGEGRQPVKLAELKNGYLRQSDYTKKTQVLADERKSFESEKAEYEPIKGWLDYINANPYLFNQVNEAIKSWNQIGEIVPLDQVLDTEAGPYINRLMTQVSELEAELNQIKGEYQSTKFDSDMNTLVSDLKAEYGDLITPEYEQQLKQQAQQEGLSPDVLKRIAKGDLAEQKLQQTQKESKKVEAKTKQKIRETKLPPQPKKQGQKPAKPEPDTNGSWLDLFKQTGQ